MVLRTLMRVVLVLATVVILPPMLGAGWLALTGIDSWRPSFAAWLSDSLGRPVTIEGPLGVSVGLVPRLVVLDVRVANPPWALAPELVRLERLELDPVPLDLLFGRLSVRRAVIRGVRLALEIGQDGRPSWAAALTPDEAPGSPPVPPPPASAPTPASAPAPAPALAPLPALLLSQLRVEDVTVTVRDHRATRIDRVHLAHLLAVMDDDPDGPLTVYGAVDLNGAPLAVTATLTTPAALLRGDAVGVQVAATATGLHLAAAGMVADPWSAGGLDIAVRVEGDRLDRLGDSLSVLAGATVAVPLDGAWSVGGRMTGSATRIGIEGFHLKLGQSEVNVSGEVLAGGRRPRVSLAMVAPRLDLHDFMPPTGADRGPTTAPADGRLIPDLPLPLAALKDIDADLRLSVDSLVLGPVILGDFELATFLRNGILHMSHGSGHLGGGEVLASFTLDARRGHSASVHAGVTMRDVAVGTVLRETGVADIISGAPVSFDASVAGAGTSLRDLLGSLSGDLLLRVGTGRIDNRTFDLLGADLIRELIGRLNPFGDTIAGPVELSCAVAGLVIRGGRVGVDRSIAIETGRTTLVVGGEVDLDKEQLDLAVRTEGKGGVTVSAGMLARLMRLKGTFLAPSLGFDSSGVARTAASAALAVATGGWSLLAETVVDAATRDRTPCTTALVRARAAVIAGRQSSP